MQSEAVIAGHAHGHLSGGEFQVGQRLGCRVVIDPRGSRQPGEGALGLQARQVTRTAHGPVDGAGNEKGDRKIGVAGDEAQTGRALGAGTVRAERCWIGLVDALKAGKLGFRPAHKIRLGGGNF